MTPYLILLTKIKDSSESTINVAVGTPAEVKNVKVAKGYRDQNIEYTLAVSLSGPHQLLKEAREGLPPSED